MLALYVPYNMFSSSFCVITCLASFVLAMLVLCHLFWLSWGVFFFFFFFCIFVSVFMLVSLCARLCHQALFLPMILRVHTHLCTRNPESLLGTLLDGTCVVHAPI